MEVVSAAQTTREASVPSFACSVSQLNVRQHALRGKEKKKQKQLLSCAVTAATLDPICFSFLQLCSRSNFSLSLIFFFFFCEPREMEPNIQTPLYRIMWNRAIMHMRNWFTAARRRLAGKTVTVMPAGERQASTWLACNWKELRHPGGDQLRANTQNHKIKPPSVPDFTPQPKTGLIPPSRLGVRCCHLQAELMNSLFPWQLRGCGPWQQAPGPGLESYHQLSIMGWAAASPMRPMCSQR